MTQRKEINKCEGNYRLNAYGLKLTKTPFRRRSFEMVRPDPGNVVWPVTSLASVTKLVRLRYIARGTPWLSFQIGRAIGTRQWFATGVGHSIAIGPDLFDDDGGDKFGGQFGAKSGAGVRKNEIAAIHEVTDSESDWFRSEVVTLFPFLICLGQFARHKLSDPRKEATATGWSWDSEIL